MEEHSRRASPMHAIHPVAAVATAAGFIVTVMSFDRYALSALAPLLLYPVAVIALSGISPSVVLKPLLLVEPLVILIGLANLWVDDGAVALGGIVFSRGWLALLSLAAKTGLAVTGALLLAGILGMDRLAAGMLQLRVPKIFVLQLMLTFRYIWVLLDEAARLATAYFLRANGRRSIAFRDWGTLAGNLLLRTYDRAERVHQAMVLRGFDGEYHAGAEKIMRGRDWMYIVCWLAYFIVVRFGDLPGRLGSYITGA